MTGDKIQKLKTELLKVLSVMSTADKDMTVREALALERAVAGSGNHSTMQPPPSRPMLPPATVRRAGGLTSAAPVPPGSVVCAVSMCGCGWAHLGQIFDTVWRHLCTRLGYVWGTFEIRLRYVWDTFGAPWGHVWG